MVARSLRPPPNPNERKILSIPVGYKDIQAHRDRNQESQTLKHSLNQIPNWDHVKPVNIDNEINKRTPGLRASLSRYDNLLRRGKGRSYTQKAIQTLNNVTLHFMIQYRCKMFRDLNMFRGLR